MSEKSQFHQKIALAIVDTVVFILSLRIAIILRYFIFAHLFKPSQPPWLEFYRIIGFVLVVWLLAFYSFRLYEINASRLETALRLAKAIAFACLVVLSASFFYRGFSFSRAVVLFFLPTVYALTLLAREAVRDVRTHLLRNPRFRVKTAIAGTGAIARHLAQALASPESSHELAGFMRIGEEGNEPVRLLGGIADLAGVKEKHAIEYLIIAEPGLPHEKVFEIIEECCRLKLEWSIVPDLYDLMLERVTVDMMDGIPLLGMKRSNITGLNYFIKRAFDFVCSAVLLLLTLPLFAVTSLLIKVTSKGPVFFAQTRLGLNGRPFKFLKFRTMCHNCDDAKHREYIEQWIWNKPFSNGGEKNGVFKITGDNRVTSVGRLLRKYSIDELPQILNVLRGEMSLIGPRPPIPYEAASYRPWHNRRFDVLPGITGMWQVSGRNNLSFEEMVKLDIEYIENWSFELDLKIFMKTISTVLSGKAY